MQLLKRMRQICLWHGSALSAFYISLQAFYICYFVFCLKRVPKIVSASGPPPNPDTLLAPAHLRGRHTPVSNRGSLYSDKVQEKDMEVAIRGCGAWSTGLGQNDEFENISQVILICFPLLKCTPTPCSTHRSPILHSHPVSPFSFKALKPLSLSDED